MFHRNSFILSQANSSAWLKQKTWRCLANNFSRRLPIEGGRCFLTNNYSKNTLIACHKPLTNAPVVRSVTGQFTVQLSSPGTLNGRTRLLIMVLSRIVECVYTSWSNSMGELRFHEEIWLLQIYKEGFEILASYLSIHCIRHSHLQSTHSECISNFAAEGRVNRHCQAPRIDGSNQRVRPNYFGRRLVEPARDRGPGVLTLSPQAKSLPNLN